MLSYNETVDYILGIPKFSKKTTHENIKVLLNRLGDPQEALKVIHVAGTNGKGSVCEFINSILGQAGYKTGMFTSPHLVVVNERIRINNSNISDDEFANVFYEVQKQINSMIQQGYEHPSFFECLFAMAALFFCDKKVDYAIFEVGMGGRLDATNIISQPRVSVITSIGLDHTAILGDTVEQIAAEKAGIIKSGVPVVFYGENDAICKVIEDKIELMNSMEVPGIKITKESYKILKKTDKDIDFYALSSYYDKCIFTAPFISEYQCANARIAIAAIELLGHLEPETVVKGIISAKWEGRMEQVLPNVYLDGSHNQDGINEFIETVNGMKNSKSKFLIFTAAKDKDYENIIKSISHNISFSGIIITVLCNERAISAETLENCFKQYGNTPIYIRENNKEALKLGLHLAGQDKLLFCAGSLYLVGSLKQILEEIV